MTKAITAQSRSYVRARATEVMECSCRIYRQSTPGNHDEETLVYTPPGERELLYEGPCRIWELATAQAVVVGDTDIYQQSTNMSIPWDAQVDVRRYDEVTVTGCPYDLTMVGKRYQIQTVAKSGALRPTRRYEMTGVM